MKSILCLIVVLGIGIKSFTQSVDSSSFVKDSHGKFLPFAIIKEIPDISFGTKQTVLNGEKSFKPWGKIKTYKWTIESAPNKPTISSPNSSITNIKNLVGGSYVVKLCVTDNDGLSRCSVLTFYVSEKIKK